MSAKPSWSCATCTFLNAWDRSRCQLCDTPRPSTPASTAPAAKPASASATPAAKPSAAHPQPKPQPVVPTTQPTASSVSNKPSTAASAPQKPQPAVSSQGSSGPTESVPIQKRAVPVKPEPVKTESKPAPLPTPTPAAKPTATKPDPKPAQPTRNTDNSNLTDTKAMQEREKARRALELEYMREQNEKAQKEIESRKVLVEEVKHKKEKDDTEKKEQQYQRQRDEESKHKAELEERQRRRQDQESKLTDIPTALKSVQENYDVSRYQQLCSTVASIIKKILDNPNEPKFRRVKLSADKIQRNIVRPLGGVVVMRKLGFYEEGDHMVLRTVDTAFLTKEYQRFSQTLQRTGTVIPAIFGKIDKSTPLESVYFAALELRNILANVVALPDERNFRCVDKTSRSFVKRLKPVVQTMEVLAEFGFQPPKTDTDIYWVCGEHPDLAKMEAGVNDLNSLISQMAPNTPIAKATVSLVVNNGKPTASRMVEKVQSCLHRIMTEPHEQKYHKIKLDKFFIQTGPIAGGKDFFTLFGFHVDVDEDVARMPYPEGFDPELLKLRSQDLHRAWKYALAATKDKRKPVTKRDTPALMDLNE